MSNEKKNIEVANGTAEEGDRVILLDEMDGYPEGVIRFDPEDGEGVWTFYPDEGEPLGWPRVDDLMKEVSLIFSPNDALEAVEEQREAIRRQTKDALNSLPKETADAIEGEFDNIIDRIQQKRKGQ
jgi:hypothetical protein